MISKWLHFTTQDLSLDSSCIWQKVAPLPDITIKLSFNSLKIAPRTSTRTLSGGLSALIEVFSFPHFCQAGKHLFTGMPTTIFPQPSCVVNTVHINSLATSSIHLSIVSSSVHLSNRPASQSAIPFILFAFGGNGCGQSLCWVLRLK